MKIFETMALIRDDRITKSLFCSADFRAAIFSLAVEFFFVGVGVLAWQCTMCMVLSFFGATTFIKNSIEKCREEGVEATYCIPTTSVDEVLWSMIQSQIIN